MRISCSRRRLRVGRRGRVPLRGLQHRLLASLDGVGKVRRTAQDHVHEGEVPFAYPLQCDKLLFVGASHRRAVLRPSINEALRPTPPGRPSPTCRVHQLPCNSKDATYTRRPMQRRCGKKWETIRSKNRSAGTCKRRLSIHNHFKHSSNRRIGRFTLSFSKGRGRKIRTRSLQIRRRCVGGMELDTARFIDNRFHFG